MDAEVKLEIERIHDEDDRQNHRIDKLEGEMASLHKIETNIEKMLLCMSNMDKELAKQSTRLDKLETAPGEAWSNTKKTIFNAALGAITGAIAMAFLYAIISFMK